MAARRRTAMEVPVYTPPVQEAPQKSLLEKAAPVLGILVVVMAFAIGSMWTKLSMLQQQAKQAPQATQTAQTQQPAAPQVSLETIKAVFARNPVIKFGDTNNAKLLMVEVADPSCPYCHVAGGLNAQLNAQIGSQFKLVSEGGSYVAPVPEMRKLLDQGKAAFAWVYMPGHGNGQMGTKALYCAYDMGKFWEVHDLLMSSKGYDMLNTTIQNDKTKSQQLVDFLASAADPVQLKACIDSGKYDQRLIDESAYSTGTLGVNGTPGFFLNTTNFAGAYSWNDMKSVADAALK